MTATAPTIEPRTCQLGGETRRRGLFGERSGPQMFVAVAVATGGLVLLVMVRSVVLLLVEAAIAGVVWMVLQRRTNHGEAWTGTLVDETRFRVARRRGTDTYSPPAGPGSRPLPSEVGTARFAGVSAQEGEPELAVVEHGLTYISTVLEVVGGGDGLRDVAEINNGGAHFGRLLFTLSRPDIPVEQIDVTTRVLPIDAEDYDTWIRERMPANVAPHLRDSMLALSEQVAFRGEDYRTFLTVRMNIEALADRARRHGPVDAGRVAEMAFEVTKQVAGLAEHAGLHVRAGLGPRRLGALIRHMYAPSFDMDDLTGITRAGDGFQRYVGQRDALVVTGDDGNRWWHATASVPRDGWPMNQVGVRWLEGLVTDVSPAMIRTVTSQFRLMPRAQTRDRARAALTFDQAAVIRENKAGKVSTGETEAQAAVPAQVLHDLLYAESGGCRPTLRVTVSAPSHIELLAGRDRIEAAATDIGITRLRWHDTRHHHAHLLTLPLGRGIK
jgi:hypothetical protein